MAAIAYTNSSGLLGISKTFPEIAADALVPLHRETGTSNLGSIDKLPYREICRYFGTYHMYTIASPIISST
jgi:hypothetical protein